MLLHSSCETYDIRRAKHLDLVERGGVEKAMVDHAAASSGSTARRRGAPVAAPAAHNQGLAADGRGFDRERQQIVRCLARLTGGFEDRVVT